MALSQHITTFINVPLQEEGHNLLVETFDLVAREKAFLVCHCLNKVRALLL